MNYETASNYDITRAVVEIKCRGQLIKFLPRDECLISGPVDYVEIETPTGNIQRVDCCNNPADAWPVIVENKISIIWDADYKTYHVGAQFNNLAGCEGGGYDFRGHSVRVKENPLRAAMIVFLMMNEDSK